MRGSYSYARVPIRTHIVSEKDDIVDVVCRYVARVAEPGDCVAVSESAVAISQGRAILSARVKPGLFARFLCRFPKKHGSLATPQAMQLAIREVGTARVLAAAVAAGLGRLFGVRGLFFRIAGPSIAAIDDIAGTLHPYEEHVVLGPRDPQSVAEAIKRRTGLDSCIVDVNDLGNVDFLAATDGLDRSGVSAALRDNPGGNDDEQTPIVVLKRRSRNAAPDSASRRGGP
ncbi:MAG: coenzyme F420-0:L-glutamate ligase [Firmicutes bacterium]|nr:coenzyme F420-0:L-glutamate ligase [Bacillota bacterium]